MRSLLSGLWAPHRRTAVDALKLAWLPVPKDGRKALPVEVIPASSECLAGTQEILSTKDGAGKMSERVQEARAGEPGSAWYEDDEFWRIFGPWMFDRTRLERAPEDVGDLVRLTAVPDKARVLDLCCGIGRHSVELAKRGYTVTAVDRTKSYLQAAQERAEREGCTLEPVLEDMRRFVRPASFELAVNLYTSFGFFTDVNDDQTVLAHVHESLMPGGKLVLEMIGKEIVARIYRERDWLEEDGVLMLQERVVCDDWSWMMNRWIAIDGAERHEYRFGHRLYSAAELRDALKRAGFARVQIYGALFGVPYDHNALRLVAVATKGAE